MAIASIVNSLIYCILVELVSNPVSDIYKLLLASFIGKFIAIGCSVIPFYLINKIYKEKNMI